MNMITNPVNVNLINRFNSMANSQPLKPQVSFGSLPKKLADKVDISHVFDRLSGYENVSHKTFENIAYYAKEAAQKGNPKPQILVEIMVRFVSGVEDMNKQGVPFSECCHKMARQLYKEFGVNQHQKDTFNLRWDYLAKMGVKGDKPEFRRITPEMEPTKQPISFSYDDVRDMLEFLRKNWSRGDAAYRNVMHGRGLKGWLSYISEELFPNHYDEFFRKY